MCSLNMLILSFDCRQQLTTQHFTHRTGQNKTKSSDRVHNFYQVFVWRGMHQALSVLFGAVICWLVCVCVCLFERARLSAQAHWPANIRLIIENCDTHRIRSFCVNHCFRVIPLRNSWFARLFGWLDGFFCIFVISNWLQLNDVMVIFAYIHYLSMLIEPFAAQFATFLCASERLFVCAFIFLSSTI